MTLAYLDNNATTRPLPAVVTAVEEALGDGFGNPSSTHHLGERARSVVDGARDSVAALLRARPSEIIFTACATESINAAVRGALECSPAGVPPRLLITTVEHEAVIELADFLERHHGVSVGRVGVDSAGRLDLEQLADELRAPTSVLSLMLANNETGVILDVAQAAGLARDAGAQVHLDAVQAVGKLELDVADLGVDFLSLSGHKFHAPKGVGVLYVRRGARFRPFMVGATQEGGRRGGTENVSGIAGIGAAAEHMAKHIPERRSHMAALAERIEDVLLALPGTRLNGDPQGRVPGTVNVSFEGIEGNLIVLTAAREGVCISAGSACSAAQYGGSHVLEAMGTPFPFLHGAVRLSCAETTTSAEVEHALDVITRAVEYLRSMNA